MKEIALVLAIGNLVALNILVLGLLLIAYRSRRVKVEMESPWPEFPVPPDRVLPTWPDRTVEIPPKEEK